MALPGDFSGLTSGVRSLYSDLASLVQVIIGIAALIILIRVVISMLNGEKESAQKLAWWLVALIVGLVLLQVLIKFLKS